MSQGADANGVGRWRVRILALVLVACGCGAPGVPLDASVAGDLAAAGSIDLGAGDLASAPDMTTMESVDGGYCFITGADCTSGITSGQGNQCCAGLCNIFGTGPEVCIACGTPGLPCCTAASDGGMFCGLGRGDVHSVCDNGKCTACGGTGQECCAATPCAAGLKCAACSPSTSGQFTLCEPSDCGTVGKSCCYEWPGSVCDGVTPNRTCTSGSCMLDATDPTGARCE